MGDAPSSNIRAVTLSAAHELWRHCPTLRLDPIRIQHDSGSPITHFARDPDGAIVVGLTARDTFWGQFAYQFSHEFGHVLALHAGDAAHKWQKSDHANQWFEESLCETASLFALRAMAKTWTTNPPYSNWKSFAPHLREYTDKLLADPARQLPRGQSFTNWFTLAEPSLRTNATQRLKNGLIAAQLLPLFEAEPARWEALAWLNLGTRDPRLPFQRYLQEWRAVCPPKHRPLVERVAALFGVPFSARKLLSRPAHRRRSEQGWATGSEGSGPGQAVGRVRRGGHDGRIAIHSR